MLNTPGWKHLKKYVKTNKRLLRAAKQFKIRQVRKPIKYQFGYQVPRIYEDALRLDMENGNHKWQDAMDVEMAQIKEYGVFKDYGKVMFLPELNKLLLWGGDVGNAYLEAQPKENLYISAGPEFAELQGHILIIYRALYGTRTGCACWHDKLFDALQHLGFQPSKADPDIWMKPTDDG